MQTTTSSAKNMNWAESSESFLLSRQSFTASPYSHSIEKQEIVQQCVLQ